MSKHTPGPWSLEEVKNDSGHIKHLVPTAEIDGERISLLTTVEHNRAIFAACYEDADARLIAAAPELLAVLQELEKSSRYWSEYDVPLGIVDRISAAIAKATGEKA